MKAIICLLSACVLLPLVSNAQADSYEMKSIDEVIQGIDELLKDIDSSMAENNFERAENLPAIQTNEDFLDNSGLDRSFRVQNELLPSNLVGAQEPTSSSLQATPERNPPSMYNRSFDQPGMSQSGMQFSQAGSMDYSNATLEDLLREVDMMELPDFTDSFDLGEMPRIQPIPEIDASPINNSQMNEPIEDMETKITDQQEKPKLESLPIEEYVVLGEEIDQEMKEKIREAIMQTRLASGGTGNPYVTRSVFRATSFCNRVLGRLNAPYQKRYRRDILLSLIAMHERNQAWVDAAKSYERFLEEFASDDNYPFEYHEDAPGIPDLQAELGSIEKWLEAQTRGAPTIGETHIRAGKIYRFLGAHRMALNKFYDAINSTLTLPENEAFELAARSVDQSYEQRLDAESNQAMIEIAETFLDSEDYDNAIKFFDRLWRLEQLSAPDRSVVRFKQGLAHYRRARANLKAQEAKERRSIGNEVVPVELDFDKTPRADFAKVKEILRGFGTLYPQSNYIPESHYLLALTYEQLSQDEESILELLKLLSEADFKPELIFNLEQGVAERERDSARINRLKAVWNFWKKKTGNYLANKFFENAEYYNAYRVYSNLRKIDSSASWQVPVLYQIALCQEKLGNYVQAMDTYTSIEEFVRMAKEGQEGLANSEYLNFVFGMAKWRKEQLEDTRAIRQAVNRYGIYTRPRDADFGIID